MFFPINKSNLIAWDSAFDTKWNDSSRLLSVKWSWLRFTGYGNYLDVSKSDLALLLLKFIVTKDCKGASPPIVSYLPIKTNRCNAFIRIIRMIIGSYTIVHEWLCNSQSLNSWLTVFSQFLASSISLLWVHYYI